MIVPVSTAPSCRPMIVTTGIRLLRSACATTARGRDTPRARAASTYSSRSSSIRVARVIRARIAASAAPSVTAGSTRCAERARARHRQPAELDREHDRQQRARARSSASRCRRATASSRPDRSRRPRKSAPMMPSGSAMHDRHDHRGRRELRRSGPAAARSPGAPACRSGTTCRDRRCTRPAEVPPVLHRAAAGRGRASSRSSARSAAGADSPSIASAGSPGTRWISRNTSVATPSSTGNRERDAAQDVAQQADR